MKPRPTSFRLLAALALAFAVSSTPALAQADAQRERIAAAYLIALGRAPSAGEVEHWNQEKKLSVTQVVAQLEQQLSNDATAQRATRAKAFADAFGRSPDSGELNTSAAHGAGTYTALMKHHLEQLAKRHDDYAQVLDRAYRLVVRRGVYPEEIAYWKGRDTLSFALLVGCIEDWARRNQPGLMVTAGTPTVSVNSGYLTTVRLSRPVAEEARAAVGLPGADTDYYSYGSGRTVIASGAGSLVSGGRIHFVAAGNESLVPEAATRG